jgi:PHD and RING finger domain-containing protein 1
MDGASTSKQQDEDNYESDSSTDSSEEEKCPICLLSFSAEQQIGKPAVCEHIFCFPCLEEWSKVVQTCPIDRKEFQSIRVYGNLECDNLLRTVKVKQKVALEELLGGEEELTSCEICQESDREDCMLLCDGCNGGMLHYSCEMNFIILSY